MLLLLSALVVILVRLMVARTRRRPRRRTSSGRAWLLASVALAGVLALAIRDAPLLVSPSARVASDAGTHMAIAHDIARHGLPHGWIPTYNGGFPIALHYPPVGWLALAGLIRLGVHPVVAVRGFGFLALLVAPCVLFVYARRLGARAVSAAAGAGGFAWVAPYIQYAGGWESFFIIGLLSQALVVPIVIAWAGSVWTSRSRFEAAPVFAALAAATHPQVFAVASVVLVAASAVSTPRALGRCIRSGLAGALVAVALYLPGVMTMAAPFGWPPDLTWRHVGFGFARVLQWIRDGDLLDYGFAPIMTSAWVIACVVLCLNLVRRAPRALLVASVVTFILCISGPSIAKSTLGKQALSVFQPMRALALVPIVAAASIVGALDECVAWLEALAPSVRDRVWSRLLPGIVTIGVLVTAVYLLPPRAAALHELARAQSRDVVGDTCPPVLDRIDPARLGEWLSRASYGRVAYASARLAACVFGHGAELASVGPRGGSEGAGAHVGVHTIAFSKLEPERLGSAKRAEALGVRTLIHFSSQHLDEESWERLDESEGLALSRRAGGTDFVGAGCVREILRGPESILRTELFSRLQNAAPTFLDRPDVLLALERGAGPLALLASPPDECDPSNATIVEVPREPGAFEAKVTTTSPVDVVFRASALPWWRVREGGSELPTRRVAPGFFSVRVTPGVHHLEAVFELPAYYVPFLALSVVCVLLCVRTPSTSSRRRPP